MARSRHTSLRTPPRYPDSYESWDNHDKSDFKRMRHNVADSLGDAASVLGPQRTLQLLLEPLQALSSQVGGDGRGVCACARARARVCVCVCVCVCDVWVFV